MKSAHAASVSDQIREHLSETYLKHAIQRGGGTFEVNVGAVHKALGLSNRVPQVCSALESKKLLEENRIRIVNKIGPPSGLSTTVTYTYEILSCDAETPSNPFKSLRGLAKSLFKELGGGEAFIRSERSRFADHSEK